MDNLARGMDLLSEWNPFETQTASANPVHHAYHVSGTLTRSSLGSHMLRLNSDVKELTTLATHVPHNPDVHDKRDRELVQQMRTRAPSQWWGSLRRLQDARRRGVSCAAAIEVWTQFGAALGLSPAKEAERFGNRDLKFFCSLSRCEYHMEKPPTDVPLKACMGCGEVRYCSRTCQVR